MNQTFAKKFFDRLGLVSLLDLVLRFQCNTCTAAYGTVRTVVWEDGGREPSSYPIPVSSHSQSEYRSFISIVGIVVGIKNQNKKRSSNNAQTP